MRVTHVADRDGYNSSPAAALLDSGATSGTGGTPFNISCEGLEGMSLATECTLKRPRNLRCKCHPTLIEKQAIRSDQECTVEIEESSQSLTGGLSADLLQQGLAVERGADVERHVSQPLRIQFRVGNVDDQVADGLGALSLGAIDPVGESQNDPVGKMLQVPGVVSNRPSAAASLITVTVAAGEPALVAVTITIVITIVSGGLTDRWCGSMINKSTLTGPAFRFVTVKWHAVITRIRQQQDLIAMT